MQEVNKDIFYRTIQNWEDVPFTQTEGFVRMQSGDNANRVRYFLDENIGCAAHLKRCMGVTMLLIDSECLKHKQTKPATLTHFYEALRQTGADIIEVNCRRPYQADYEIGLRQAGFLRPVGSFSFQLTNLIDLTKPLSFNENWKRNLKQSGNENLSLVRIDNPTGKDMEDFMRIYREMTANKNLPMPFTKDSLHALLTDPHFHLCFAVRGPERLSGIIYHQVGTHAGLLYAANSEKANQIHAGFQLYKQLLTLLAKEGVQTFDMEKMAPSTHSTNAVFLFKQGIRGQLTPLCGEWTWYKRNCYSLCLYFVKKYFWKKIQA